MKPHYSIALPKLWLGPVVTVMMCGSLASNRVTAIAQGPDKRSVVQSDQHPQQPELNKVAVAYLTHLDLPDELRGAMQETLRRHPAESSWSGRNGDRLFAIAIRRLPLGQIRQRAVPGMLRLTHAVAVAELLKMKAVLDDYEADGLTDVAALRAAVIGAAETLDVAGSVRGIIHQTGVQDGYAAGYVVANIENVTAHLRRPAPLKKVKDVYRDVIHGRMQKSMERKQWSEALAGWKHLHKLGLTSEALYVDAARCLVELGREPEAIESVEQFLGKVGSIAKPATLEQLGDILLKVDSPAAQDVATAAYLAASERLRNFRSTSGIEP